MTFDGLDFMIGVAAAIVVMALVQAAIDWRLGPDPDLRGDPWHPDSDHALRPRPTEPVRDERGVGWPRTVAPETESEKRAAWGDR